jgi:hypothetical protein
MRGRAPLCEGKSVASFAQLRWFNLKNKASPHRTLVALPDLNVDIIQPCYA